MVDLNKKNNIYYIGIRLSDIAKTFDGNTPDDFFKGSITCYGDGKNGNIAYNDISGIQLRMVGHTNDSKENARDDAIYTKFIGVQCRRIVESDPSALFFPYSVYFAAKIPEEFKDRIVCCNDLNILSYLNSKFNFKKLIQGKINQANFEIKKGNVVLNLIKTGVIPNEKEVVVQTEFGTGGYGTFILTKKSLENKDFLRTCQEEIKPSTTYVVSDYIDNIYSGSFQIQISNNEIAMYPAGIQLMKGPKWIGNDLFEYTQLDEDIKQEVIEMAQTFGALLKNIGAYAKIKGIASDAGLRGHFGLDFIIAKKGKPRVFAIETNPRFTGVTGLINILCHKAGIGSVFEHTYQAFYNESSNLVEKFKKVSPNGRKRHAEVERDKDGNLRSKEDESYNREGLDETVYQEDGIYTHAVYEEVLKYNVFDDRGKYKKYVAVQNKKKKS